VLKIEQIVALVAVGNSYPEPRMNNKRKGNADYQYPEHGKWCYGFHVEVPTDRYSLIHKHWAASSTGELNQINEVL